MIRDQLIRDRGSGGRAMSKDNSSKRYRFQTWFLDVFPKYLLLLILIGCIVVAIYFLFGPAVGNGYSNIYGETWCYWHATAKSWLDKDENGKWDANEPPLPGVQFTIGWDHSVSGLDGRGYGMMVAQNACSPSYEIEISATPPVGYRLTTSGQLISPGGEGDHGPFLFGFASLSREPTTTPASYK